MILLSESVQYPWLTNSSLKVNSYAKTFKWISPFDKVLNWNFDEPKVEWFINGKLNITENIFERNLSKIKDKIAIIWEPNDPNNKVKKITYKELYYQVCQFSNALKKKNVKKGDRVIIYMPMVPEAVVAMLSCARLGAIHSVVFAGFSANSLSDRINDSGAKVIITSDGNYRGNKIIPVKKIVDQAIQKTNSIETVIVLNRTNMDVSMNEDRDFWIF